jgi:phosphoribosylamine--glycine ligase
MASPRRILVIGAGGREHAIAWRLARDPHAPDVLCAPGNDGIRAAFRTLAIPEHDMRALTSACRHEDVDLVVIGPEAPLAAGLADALVAEGVTVYGPSAAAARLESSKHFAKQVMYDARVPTARAESFEDLATARAALGRFGPPWVVKADGLAGGKGVCVTSSRDEAETFLAACLDAGRFGASGRTVLLEEFLPGEEATVMAVCDGKHFVLLPPARDHKRAHDGDRGPNTGGMGAWAPASHLDDALEAWVGDRIVAPVLEAMERRGTPFRGTLYAGLMVREGTAAVVEFNARFGDPETQVVLPLVEGSLSDLLAGAARGALDPHAIRRADRSAVAIALVDEGYPESARGGGVIEGLDAVAAGESRMVFHAGTRREGGSWGIAAGRAAYVVAVAPQRDEARRAAYAAIETLGGHGWRCRTDIAAAVATPAAGARGGA